MSNGINPKILYFLANVGQNIGYLEPWANIYNEEKLDHNLNKILTKLGQRFDISLFNCWKNIGHGKSWTKLDKAWTPVRKMSKVSPNLHSTGAPAFLFLTTNHQPLQVQDGPSSIGGRHNSGSQGTRTSQVAVSHPRKSGTYCGRRILVKCRSTFKSIIFASPLWQPRWQHGPRNCKSPAAKKCNNLQGSPHRPASPRPSLFPTVCPRGDHDAILHKWWPDWPPGFCSAKQKESIEANLERATSHLDLQHPTWTCSIPPGHSSLIHY